MTLDQLPNNVPATIVSCSHSRLRDLGFFENERVMIVARAPFGGGFAVKVSNSKFALNTEEAKMIKVTIL